jgi:tetratricopeptide (TPR) repeat protein
MAGTSQPGRVSRPPGPSARPAAWHLVLVGVLALGVYASTLGAGFVWDDEEIVVHNPLITSLGNLPVIFRTHAFAKVSAAAPGHDLEYWRPVWVSTLAFDHALWGLRPLGYHLTNVLLHVATSLAVYLLVLALARGATIALVAALLFAVHPVHAEAVAWVSGRNDLLVTLFTTAAFVGYLRVRSGRGLLTGAATLAAYVLGVLSKESAAVLPALALLWELGEGRRGLLRRSLGPLVLAAATVPYLLLRAATVGTVPRVGDLDIAGRLLQAPRILLESLRLLVLPVRLKVFYDLRPTGSVSSAGAWFAVLLLVLVVASLVWLHRRDRLVAFGLGWALVALLPVSGIPAPIHPAAMADRYGYLPSVGVCLVGGLLLARAQRPAFVKRVVAPGVLVLLAAATLVRAPLWRDFPTFVNRMIADAPREAIGYYNRGALEMRAGQVDAGLSDLETAARLLPPDPRALARLAGLAMQTGRLDRARGWLAAAVKLDSTFAAAHVMRGRLEYAAGRPEEAARAYRAALAREPRNAEAHVGLGAIWRARGRLADAEREYRAALDSDPRNAAAHQNLGNLYASQDRMDEAAREFTRAVELAPREATPHYNFGMLLEAQGKHREAEAEYRTAAALDSSLAQAHYSLGALLWKQGRTREALEEMRTAVRLAPGVPAYRQMLEAIERGEKP